MTGAAVQKAFWCTIVTLFQMEEIKEKNLKKIAQLLSQKTSFVNCQQHKYFVLLFVPFCKKKNEEKKQQPKKNQKGTSLLFQACVYSATAILVSKYRTVHAQPCRSTL